MILDFKGWLASEGIHEKPKKYGGKHGGSRKCSPFGRLSVRAVNPARDVTFYPSGPAEVKGKLKSFLKLKKPYSGIVGRMKKK
jgi:hypothetical protein